VPLKYYGRIIRAPGYPRPGLERQAIAAIFEVAGAHEFHRLELAGGDAKGAHNVTMEIFG
jgi:hypothetical protein